MMGVIAAGLIVAGCGDKDAQRAEADAGAVGFVPPSVTSRLDFGASMERRFRTLDRNADYTPLSYYPLSVWPWQTAVKAVFLDRVDIVAPVTLCPDRTASDADFIADCGFGG
ncbi:MAG: hypothetical protein EOP68_05280 [Sphingomonas sp.]|nr:MAG: hypothetical protein EOP68_05280 [Sphingomonas sp.]